MQGGCRSYDDDTAAAEHEQEDKRWPIDDKKEEDWTCTADAESFAVDEGR